MRQLSDLHENALALCGDAGGTHPFRLPKWEKCKVNILAMGDVGGILLTGLVLLGGDIVSGIGIFDIRENVLVRYEAEMNQIAYAKGAGRLPKTEIIKREDDLFDCGAFVFCATKEVPGLGADAGAMDVRMAQYAENKVIIEHYAKIAAAKSFRGLFAVVSDPVDPLCKAACRASGLDPLQFRGFGLGVMHGRALYYAQKEERFSRYAKEGRVFGPHGAGLVAADSISNYDDGISRELTEKVVNENVRMRRAGFKPYIAPGLSSGAISILQMLRGEWHYSSNYIGDGRGGAFFGALNRQANGIAEIENPKLPDELFGRIKKSYEDLKKI